MAGQPLPISHPRLQQLYAYWSTKKGQRRMPSRADIDVLCHVVAAEVYIALGLLSHDVASDE